MRYTVTGQLADTQLNSTQRASMDAGVKHLNVHIYVVTIAYRYYNQLISRTDLSPIPVQKFKNTPTRRLPTRGLHISRTGQLAY